MPACDRPDCTRDEYARNLCKSHYEVERRKRNRGERNLIDADAYCAWKGTCDQPRLDTHHLFCRDHQDLWEGRRQRLAREAGELCLWGTGTCQAPRDNGPYCTDHAALKDYADASLTT